MVRISDARMSGTAYGTVILHMVPEAAAGGLLALVQNGDMIELDVAKGRLSCRFLRKKLSRRKKAWKKPKPPLPRGYWKLYFDHVLQADQGADLDFLAGNIGAFRAARQSLGGDTSKNRHHHGRRRRRRARGRHEGARARGGLRAVPAAGNRRREAARKSKKAVELKP